MVDNTELLHKFPDIFWFFLQPLIREYENNEGYEIKYSQFVEEFEGSLVEIVEISQKVDKQIFDTSLLQKTLTPQQSIRVKLPKNLVKMGIYAYHETNKSSSQVKKLRFVQVNEDMMEITNSESRIINSSATYESRKTLDFHTNGCTQTYYVKGRRIRRPFLFQDVQYWTSNAISKSIMLSLYSILGQQETLYFWKDCVQELVTIQHTFDLEDSLISIPWIAPVSFQDVFHCYSKKNWMESKIAKKYKPLLHMNWNHHLLFYGYLVYKSLPYLDKASQQVIQNTKWENESDLLFLTTDVWGWLYNNGTIIDRVQFFLTKWLWLKTTDNRNYEQSETSKFILYNVVEMMFKDKYPISLRKSFRHILAYHDRRVEEIKLEQMPEIRISKKSKFHQLRKLLPKEYEWITSKERLYKEGQEMHNCVAIYADKIVNDECAIYSIEVNGTRYTAKFGVLCQNGKTEFTLVQLESKYNQGYNVQDWEKLEGYLK